VGVGGVGDGPGAGPLFVLQTLFLLFHRQLEPFALHVFLVLQSPQLEGPQVTTGLLVGAAEGNFVGADVTGLLVGTGVTGLLVGAAVGDFVGADVTGLLVGVGVTGLLVGAAVGDFVGADVTGLLVGAAVGDFVGADVTGLLVGADVTGLLVGALVMGAHESRQIWISAYPGLTAILMVSAFTIKLRPVPAQLV
jgi:hypothetical protein